MKSKKSFSPLQTLSLTSLSAYCAVLSMGSYATHAAEVELCARLGAAMAAAKGDKALELVLWDDNWQTVYALAEATMARTMSEFMDE